jgi:molybdate transport system ATP-binding protein
MIRVDVALKLGAFDLSVAFENEAGITALFGRSGSGKSMTINLIAGLARPDRGRIVLEDRVLVDTEAAVFLPKHRRRVGLVFQDAQLFPHLTVKQNLMFGRWFAPASEAGVAFDKVVDTLGIGHLLNRHPGRLSGGEKQRIAIGRALLASPKILLMDEPLASLDSERKLEILPLIESLRDEFHMPIVYVSHAVEEVARLAARVVVLQGGRVAAMGTVEEVMGSSRRDDGESRFARSSVIAGRICRIDDEYGLTEISHPAGTIWLAGRAGPPRREAHVVIKATDITLSKTHQRDLSAQTILRGTVASVETGDSPLAAVAIRLDGHGQLVSFATRRAVDQLGLGPGDQVFALVKTVALDEQVVPAIESWPRSGP